MMTVGTTGMQVQINPIIHGGLFPFHFKTGPRKGVAKVSGNRRRRVMSSLCRRPVGAGDNLGVVFGFFGISRAAHA